nr:dual specificity protein phosphatase 22 isoform X5 [Kogia breviceps]
MGNGMNKILPGLYIGNFKDARDAEQLSKNKVTHILSVHDSARPTLEGVKYLCIPAADSPSQNLEAQLLVLESHTSLEKTRADVGRPTGMSRRKAACWRQGSCAASRWDLKCFTVLQSPDISVLFYHFFSSGSSGKSPDSPDFLFISFFLRL